MRERFRWEKEHRGRTRVGQQPLERCELIHEALAAGRPGGDRDVSACARGAKAVGLMRPEPLDAGAPQTDGKLRRQVERSRVGRLARRDVFDMNEALGMIAFGEAGKNAFGIHVTTLTRAPDKGAGPLW